MVKIKHSFKNLSQSPYLEALLKEARTAVKGLSCPNHPSEQSTVTLRIINNHPDREYQVCCSPFEQTIREAILRGRATS